MEELIKFTEFTKSLGYNLDDLPFKEVVKLFARVEKSIKYSLDPLHYVEKDLQEMKSA